MSDQREIPDDEVIDKYSNIVRREGESAADTYLASLSTDQRERVKPRIRMLASHQQVATS